MLVLTLLKVILYFFEYCAQPLSPEPSSSNIIWYSAGPEVIFFLVSEQSKQEQRPHKMNVENEQVCQTHSGWVAHACSLAVGGSSPCHTGAVAGAEDAADPAA